MILLVSCCDFICYIVMHETMKHFPPYRRQRLRRLTNYSVGSSILNRFWLPCCGGGGSRYRVSHTKQYPVGAAPREFGELPR